MLKVGDMILLKTENEWRETREIKQPVNPRLSNTTNIIDSMVKHLGSIRVITELVKDSKAFYIEGCYCYWRRDSIKVISRKEEQDNRYLNFNFDTYIQLF